MKTFSEMRKKIYNNDGKKDGTICVFAKTKDINLDDAGREVFHRRRMKLPLTVCRQRRNKGGRYRHSFRRDL